MCISPPEIAQVIAPYTATGAEQLTLAPGQLILIRKKNPGGWWEGELQVGKFFLDIAEILLSVHKKKFYFIPVSTNISLRVYAVRVCLINMWNSNGLGVTLWPNTADLCKVLSQANLNQPICLGQFVPPPRKREDEPVLFCPVWDSVILIIQLHVL